MSQRQVDILVKKYAEKAAERRAQEFPKRPSWWRWVGVSLMLLGGALFLYEVAQFNPWQFGVLLSLGTIVAGYYLFTAHLEGERSGLPYAIVTSGYRSTYDQYCLRQEQIERAKRGEFYHPHTGIDWRDYSDLAKDFN